MPSETTYGTIETGRPAGAPEIIFIEVSRRHRRCTCKSVALWLFFSILVFFAILSALFWSFGSFAICSGLLNPPFDGPKDRSDFKNQSFSVGFDLTAGYGTAAVLFNNGTTVNVARVEGTPEYNDVLAHLSLASSVHPTPPYYNCEAQSQDLSRQWVRYLRKRTRQPASSAVAALASVLGKLKEETNTFLGPLGPLEQAFITIPSLPALYNEELLDAADYVKFQMLTLPWHIHRSGDQAQWPVSEINAAFAGNGLGLEHLNLSSDDSYNPMPKEPWSDNVFSVLFTNKALAAYVTPLSSAPHFYAASGIVNFTLGLCSASTPLSHTETDLATLHYWDYWANVRLALRTALASYNGRGDSLGRVVSYGEAAHNEVFDLLLREEVILWQASDDPKKMPEFSSRHPVFAGARGAAAFAKYCSTLPPYTSCFPDLKPRQQGW